MRRAFSEAAERADPPDDFRKHDLRHRRVTTWLSEGHSAVKVQKAMGHSDLKTTMGYYTFVRSGADRFGSEPPSASCPSRYARPPRTAAGRCSSAIRRFARSTSVSPNRNVLPISRTRCYPCPGSVQKPLEIRPVSEIFLLENLSSRSATKSGQLHVRPQLLREV